MSRRVTFNPETGELDDDPNPRAEPPRVPPRDRQAERRLANLGTVTHAEILAFIDSQWPTSAPRAIAKRQAEPEPVEPVGHFGTEPDTEPEPSA